MPIYAPEGGVIIISRLVRILPGYCFISSLLHLGWFVCRLVSNQSEKIYQQFPVYLACLVLPQVHC